MTTRIFIGLIVFLALASLVMVVALGEGQRMETFDQAFNARSIENGAALFQTNCQGCHGIQGKGIAGVAPALNSFNFFNNRLDEVGYTGSLASYIEGTISAGRPIKSADWPRPMPTWSQEFGGPLRKDQIEDLSTYILNWRESALAEGPAATPPPVSDDPVVRGQQIFLGTGGCAGCHTVAGLEGAAGQVGPELTHIASIAAERVAGQSASEYLHTSILQPSAYVVADCPNGPCADNVMPQNFGERLTQQEIDDLVTFLLTLE
jgi:mono/diheme cytochrome c family protein